MIRATPTFWPGTKELQSISLLVTGGSLERLKTLVDRALNTWDSAHPELKELGDMLTHGKVTQDYYGQTGMVKNENE
jgi:alkylhydroperoxidase/carboxymuconolactone decarboxylase family protein YurZ